MPVSIHFYNLAATGLDKDPTNMETGFIRITEYTQLFIRKVMKGIKYKMRFNCGGWLHRIRIWTPGSFLEVDHFA